MHDELGLIVLLVSDVCIFLFIALFIIGLLLDFLHGAATLVSEEDTIVERFEDEGVAVETVNDLSHAVLEDVNAVSDALLHRLLRNWIDLGIHLDCEQVLGVLNLLFGAVWEEMIALVNQAELGAEDLSLLLLGNAIIGVSHDGDDHVEDD